MMSFIEILRIIMLPVTIAVLIIDRKQRRGKPSEKEKKIILKRIIVLLVIVTIIMLLLNPETYYELIQGVITIIWLTALIWWISSRLIKSKKSSI